jgi:hypothetical protein
MIDIRMIYDYIIIGSGFGGLYTAYNIKKTQPEKKFIILEKNNEIGGRCGYISFHGMNVPIGAGIGRKDTNPLLIELCKELKINIKETLSVVEYSSVLENYFDINKILEYLRKKYNKNKQMYRKMTFREFGTSILGEYYYNLFVLSNGYSDFEDASVPETLYDYGIEDNAGGWIKLFIPWSELLQKMVQHIHPENIIFNKEVHGIAKMIDKYDVMTTGTTYSTNKIIIATTINGIRKLLPQYPIYKQIHGQPFIRIYAKFDKSIELYVKEYTVVPYPLQKIIPMNHEKGIYMIGYADNKNAMILHDYIRNNSNKNIIFQKLVEKSLGIPENYAQIIDMIYIFWENGTHYYEPLSDEYDDREEFIRLAQKPEPNIYVAGEAVSKCQGWVEGALESVKAII